MSSKYPQLNARKDKIYNVKIHDDNQSYIIEVGRDRDVIENDSSFNLILEHISSYSLHISLYFLHIYTFFLHISFILPSFFIFLVSAISYATCFVFRQHTTDIFHVFEKPPLQNLTQRVNLKFSDCLPPPHFPLTGLGKIPSSPL